jgi:hypothetical protein
MIATSQARTADPQAAKTVACALTVLLTATAFSGVLADARWVWPALLTVGVVVATGMTGRTLRWWPPLVVLTQLAAVLIVLTMLFTDTALLGVLPGSASVDALMAVLSHALDAIRDGSPPIPADPPLQCLVCLGLGLVAVLVDVIAVATGTPAVAGLVLLCVFAVPASLARALLPWWAFLASAVGFALLLMSGGQHSAAEQLRRSRNIRIRAVLGRQAATITGTGAVIALLAGAVFTGVGTEGRLPGATSAGFGTTSDPVGLRPFTSLRGQLTRDRPIALFRVRGLPQSAYLRAMTLRKFDPQQGWALDGLTQGVDASGALPPPEGTTAPTGQPLQVQIDPVGYRDAWLPMFGIPTRVSGMGPNWRYDPAAGMVFTQTRQQSRPYTEDLVLPTPDVVRLREATGPSQVDPAYLDTTGIPQQIKDLATRITSNDATPFDKAVALNEYFTNPANGFTYSLATAPPSGSDALSDFLFRGKRGYCEQFASSMAVLLRAIGIPSRVAVGFTSGFPEGNQRMITTSDAHAWVEAYFPGSGWTTFDPTPLNDGRNAAPSYLDHPLPPALPPQREPSAPAPRPALPGIEHPGVTATPSPAGGPGAAGSPLWPDIALCALVLALLLAAPAGLREIRRRQRFNTVAAGTPGAASTAWREVLDEFRDRGSQPRSTDTVRALASNLAARHDLDDEGTQALQRLVAAVEREWYAPSDQPDQAADSALRDSLRTVLEALRRSSPLGWRRRLLPRSVLRTPAKDTQA